MPYDLTTKDGITIRNIPDGVDPNSQEMRARVASIRSGSRQPASPLPPLPRGATLDEEGPALNGLPPLPRGAVLDGRGGGQSRFTPEQIAVLKATDPTIVRQALEQMGESDRAELMSALQGGQPPPAHPMQDGMMVSHAQAPAPAPPQMMASHTPGAPLPDSVTNPAPPETTAAGLAGAVNRGLMPYAASLAAGPEGPAVVAVAKMLDPLAQGLTSIKHSLGLDPYIADQMTPSDVMNHLMDKLGVGKARTPVERMVQTGAETAGNALGTVGLGKMLQGTPPTVNPAPTRLQAAGNILAQNPTQQVVGAATAGASSQAAKEMGFGPTEQTIAGVAGGLLGGMASQPRTLKNAYALRTDVANSESLGIKPMTTDVLPPDTFGTRWLQKQAEKIPFVGTGGPRRVQQTQRIDAIKDLLSEYGAGDMAQASDSVMADLLKKRSADLTKYTGMKTDVVGKLAQAGPVSVDRTVAEIDNQIGRLASLNTNKVQPVIDSLVDFKTAIQGQDLGNIETLRKQIGKAFRDPSLTSVRDTGEKALTAIYKPLKEDLGDYIQANAGTQDYNKWMVANKRLSQMAGELKNDALSSVLEKGDQVPETVQRMLFSKKPSEARALYRGLSPDGQANARMALLSKALESATQKAAGPGGVDLLSPDKFSSEVKRLGAPMGVFFKGADEQRLRGLVRALDLTKHASEVATVPNNGSQAVPYLIADSLSNFFGGPVGATVGAMGVGGMARVYESAPVRNLLMRLPTVKPGSAEEQAIFKRLLALQTPQNSPDAEVEQ